MTHCQCLYQSLHILCTIPSVANGMLEQVCVALKDYVLNVYFQEGVAMVENLARSWILRTRQTQVFVEHLFHKCLEYLWH